MVEDALPLVGPAHGPAAGTFAAGAQHPDWGTHRAGRGRIHRADGTARNEAVSGGQLQLQCFRVEFVADLVVVAAAGTGAAIRGLASAADAHSVIISLITAEECARFLHSVCRGMTSLPEQAQPVEDALARFSSRLLCPEFDVQDQTTTLGDSLYQAYISGKVSPLALRRLFLAKLETREQVRRTSDALEGLARA